MVKSIYQAEEAYYLANGEYTKDLPLLDIEVALEEACIYKNSDPEHSYYRCENVSIGVYDNATDVQVQTRNIGYLQFLTDDESEDFNESLKKGDIMCLSSDDTAKKVCRSLGPIKKEKEVSAGPWTYMVILQ